MDERRKMGRGGRVPRTVECELTEDLCDSCQPGDIVKLSGVVKVVSSEETAGKKSKQSAEQVKCRSIEFPKGKG